MTEKLDKLSNDILSLLKNHEPERLRHHEICDSLFNSYEYNYKDKKVFGVAVSQKLTLLKALRLIIHEDIWYGTLNSKPAEQKPSAKIMVPNPMLNEKERTLYRLDVECLAIEKQIAEGHSNDSEWAEWIKRKEDVFQQKWGIVNS